MNLRPNGIFCVTALLREFADSEITNAQKISFSVSENKCQISQAFLINQPTFGATKSNNKNKFDFSIFSIKNLTHSIDNPTNTGRRMGRRKQLENELADFKADVLTDVHRLLQEWANQSDDAQSHADGDPKLPLDEEYRQDAKSGQSADEHATGELTTSPAAPSMSIAEIRRQRRASRVPNIQVGLHAPAHIVAQFRAYCDEHRCTYGEALEELLRLANFVRSGRPS